MKKIFTLFLISLLTFSCAKKNKGLAFDSDILISEEFVQGSEDIPLLVGMEKIPSDSVGFDTSSGSIITSAYTTNFSLKKVQNFYNQVLPKMGWKLAPVSKNKLILMREKERLEIEFTTENGRNVVRFFMSSRM